MSNPGVHGFGHEPFFGLIMGWDKTKIRHIPIEG